MTRHHRIDLLLEHLRHLLIQRVIVDGVRETWRRREGWKITCHRRADRHANGLTDRLPGSGRLLHDGHNVARYDELGRVETGDRKNRFSERRPLRVVRAGEAAHTARQHRLAHHELAAMRVDRLGGNPNFGRHGSNYTRETGHGKRDTWVFIPHPASRLS